jgi:hypothetical protein
MRTPFTTKVTEDHGGQKTRIPALPDPPLCSLSVLSGKGFWFSDHGDLSRLAVDDGDDPMTAIFLPPC